MRNRFTQKQELILLALARFQMLTYDHIKQLYIDKHSSNIHKALRPLRETRRKLVDAVYIVDAHDNKVGIKKELMFYLTEKGANFLIDELEYPPEKIKRPKGRIDLLTSDSHHRKQMISCVIELFASAEKKQILWHDFYFEKNRNRRKTRIDLDKGYIEADMFFLLEREKNYLFGLEYERKPDVKRIVDKIYKYVHAIAQGQPTTYLVSQGKMKFQRDMAVLYIFEDQVRMESVIDRLATDPIFKKYENYFFFKSYDEVRRGDFFEGWLNVYKQRVSMF
ncbi:MAG: hypothetical protein DWQ02_08385 [Bacteroidetes bacterium]|nr:MAG: hypothetical protein DWQ02_08385 [Bacteroidota bacterium]